MTALVSVVILSHDRKRNVHELLTSLRRQSYSSFEVILVDNGSTDGTAEMVRRTFPETTLIESGGNLGMVAYNLGFAAAQGEYTVVMDDDGLPAADDWIGQVVAQFERNSRLGIVSCTIRMRDTGRIAHDSPQFAPFGRGEGGYPCVGYNGTGAGIRTIIFKQIGYYPPYFFNTYLELYLATLALDKGWEVRHFPELEVWHSRPTGSSHPIASYLGLRNYYWYICQLYPASTIPNETLHRIGYNFKLWRGGHIKGSVLMRATLDAVRGATYPARHRRPISLTTLQYVRWVRRHGNWHGIAPEVRPFHLDLPAPQ